VRACSASVERSSVPQKQRAAGVPWGELGSPRRRRRAARKLPSERRDGQAVGRASSQADADRHAMLRSLAIVCMRVSGGR
jgi:hypothetical protein